MKVPKVPIVAIAGNPNCGKTTLFNGLTGSSQKIGNWPGVTVEKKTGELYSNGQKFLLVDLPGIYSLSAVSEDEKIAADFLLNGQADLVVNIVDAVCLERSLYLTVQLAEMGIPLLVVINRADIALKSKTIIDTQELSHHLGCPVVMISAIQSSDIAHVIEAIHYSINNPGHPVVTVKYPEPIERAIQKLSKNKLYKNEDVRSSRGRLLTLIEGGGASLPKGNSGYGITVTEIEKEVRNIEKEMEESADIAAADARYSFINAIAPDVIKSKGNTTAVTNMIDSIVLNRVLGIPIFLFIMYMIFWVTVAVGGAFIDFFDIAAGTLFVDMPRHILSLAGAPAWISLIIADGVGTGIQTVATFIPVVVTMFLMISILEDSGYMARAAFVMDRLMKGIGLSGKAFVPLIVGFGCSVPAVMGTRTLESKNDRLLTSFIIPFMSCGAKLPVYVLFAAAFFAENAGMVVFSLYIMGILLAVITALILKLTLFKGSTGHFVMELPLYNIPRPASIIIYTWNRLKIFLFKASKVIIAAVFILALLNSIGTDGSFGNEDSEKSILAGMSKQIAPVFEPMGISSDNWPATVSIFTGLFAKEAIVGTLNSLYSQKAEEAREVQHIAAEPQAEEHFSIIQGLVDAWKTIPENLSGVIGGLADPLGTDVLESTQDAGVMAQEMEVDTTTFGKMRGYFTDMQAYAYLLFILLYFPCVAAFGALYRETGLRLALFQAIYLTIFAWITATVFYQIVEGHSIEWIATAGVLMLSLVFVLYVMGKKNYGNVREG